MAINSPGSKRSRELPRLTPVSTTTIISPMSRHQQLNVDDPASPASEMLDNLTSRSPGTPRVFTFPPPQGFEEARRGRIASTDSSNNANVAHNSNNSVEGESLSSAGGLEDGDEHQAPSTTESTSSVFEFCTKRKKTFVKTLSYSPKSAPFAAAVNKVTTETNEQERRREENSRGDEFIQRARRNSCFSLGGIKQMSNFPPGGGENKRRNVLTRNVESTPKLTATNDLQLNYEKNNGYSYSESKIEGKKKGQRLGSLSLNKSQGCLEETFLLDNVTENSSPSTNFNSTRASRGHIRRESRKSTSDLNDLLLERDTATGYITPADKSPTNRSRRGSIKTGGLAYLASRRGSRDSQISNISNVSNEDIGPLNFSAHPRGRQRRTSNFLELPVADHIRPRVHSLPEKAYNPRATGDDLYRLRAFSITHKGVVMNRGDSIISRRSRSNTSVNSSRNSNVSGESRSPFEGSCCSGQGVGADSTTDESDVETNIPKYRVVLLGDSGVGKSALVSQFMTSEYMNTYDASLDDEFGEKTVSILLDGEESEMVFIDHPHVEMSVENSLSTYEPHACIVVYSIVSRGSFQVAEEMLNYLWQEHFTQERSVIVVGNKSDLARSRKITANEGKQLATSRECKFIETSSGIQHNVDELLVGALKQVRLRETREKKLRRQGSRNNKGKQMLSKLHSSKTALSLNLARDMLNKMCLNDSKSKSCENLHVL